MKNTLYKLICIIGFAGWANYITGCMERPKVVPPPPAVVVPDSQFCKVITGIEQPPSAVGVKSKYWTNGQAVRIKLTGGTAAQRKYIEDAFGIWGAHANLDFGFVTTGPADIRCSFVRGGGSWSYIGTDAKIVDAKYPTMNIGWDGLDVALHEVGHALGFAHEQQSPRSTICWNKERVYTDLGGPPNNWSRETVDHNVFGQLKASEVDATAFDGLSIMEYSIPDSWTCDGKGIPGGKVLTDTDKGFIGTIYPRKAVPPPGKTLTAAQLARFNALLDECKNMLK